MRRLIGMTGALLALGAGAAGAQTVRPAPLQPFGVQDAARLEQQRLGDQAQTQALGAAQSRLRTQQTLQALELARPLPPVVPENYPWTSSVRSRPATQAQQRTAQGAPEATSTPLPADAATRGDLPL